MTQAPNPAAEALLAPGVPIVLADGSTTFLKYDMLSLYQIEVEYGSVGALLQQAKKANGEDAMNGPIIGLALDLVRFGWTEQGVRSTSLATREEVAIRLDLSLVSGYIGSALTALTQAFGPEVPVKGSEGGGYVDPTHPSPGSNSGAPQPGQAFYPVGSGG